MFKRFSDKSIIDGIRRQDEKILNWLYDTYLPLVRKHILQNSGTPDDVSDIFQDSIIILYNQIKDNKFSLNGDLKGYFFGIARNRWKEILRARRETVNINEEIIDESDTEEAGNILLERIVSRAFQKLKPEFQAVLKLYSEGKSFDEIAAILDLKSDTYARRKKYLSKEALMEIIREDPEFQEYRGFSK